MEEIIVIVQPIVTEVTVIVQEGVGGTSPATEARIVALEEFQLNGTINGGIIF